ncbi:MAG: DUF3380 domain-containing protein [Rhodospirillaceae bacterium]|nr:DUF3380 domain-containing protein [Rhodospirillaceae bacterium]
MSLPLSRLRAFAEIESGYLGAFLASKRPTILFESHVFRKHSGGRHDGVTDPKGKPISTVNWDKTTYGKAGEWQWTRFQLAFDLDNDAAIQAASWELFQVLGENALSIGYESYGVFAEQMCDSAANHLRAAVQYLVANNLLEPLRAANWPKVAKKWNGPAYKENQFDIKLAEADARIAAELSR